MTFDLVVSNARLLGHTANILDVGVRDGQFVEIGVGLPKGVRNEDAAGQLVVPGLVETHIHLDKTGILDRCAICEGTVAEAIAETAKAKLAFTQEDIYARGRKTLERAIANGTQYMRAHTEVDPRIGLKGFHAVRALARDYAWAIDLGICVYPQEGLTNDPGSFELLVEACELGVDAIGGCPYTDPNPHAQIATIFELALRFDLDVDFHLDFDLDPTWNHIEEVCRQTEANRWGGRVAVGHMTKLSAMPLAAQIALARRMADAGVALTVIPSTDLFLMGRDAAHNVPRGVARADRFLDQGVTVSLATNNVMNAFTPFGDASLIRMANLYANIAQLGRRDDLDKCLAMISTSAARLINLKGYGLTEGNEANFVVLAAETSAAAVAALAQPLVAYKRGSRTVTRAAPILHRPQVEKSNGSSAL